jgi:hypothetical protein
MDLLKHKVMLFMDRILYSNADNISKLNAYNAILEEAGKISATRDEKEYIQSQLRKVTVIDMYTVPVVKKMCLGFTQRFNIYYGIDDYSQG